MEKEMITQTALLERGWTKRKNGIVYTIYGVEAYGKARKRLER